MTDTTEEQPQFKKRLSDRILDALKHATEQGREDIVHILAQALELSMKSKKPGGAEVEERRDYPEEIESFMRIFDDMGEKGRGGY